MTLIKDLSMLCVVDRQESYGTFKIMLSNVANYLENHFWEEEKYMKIKEYPKYGEHKEIHRKMLEDIKGMAMKIETDKLITIKSVTAYLIEWYTEHLLRIDKEMGEFFEKNGMAYENSI